MKMSPIVTTHITYSTYHSTSMDKAYAECTYDHCFIMCKHVYSFNKKYIYLSCEVTQNKYVHILYITHIKYQKVQIHTLDFWIYIQQFPVVLIIWHIQWNIVYFEFT